MHATRMSRKKLCFISESTRGHPGLGLGTVGRCLQPLFGVTTGANCGCRHATAGFCKNRDSSRLPSHHEAGEACLPEKVEIWASLLGARALMVAPGRTTRNKGLLGTSFNCFQRPGLTWMPITNPSLKWTPWFTPCLLTGFSCSTRIDLINLTWRH